jgi:hypothetical protein
MSKRECMPLHATLKHHGGCTEQNLYKIAFLLCHPLSVSGCSMIPNLLNIFWNGTWLVIKYVRFMVQPWWVWGTAYLQQSLNGFSLRVGCQHKKIFAKVNSQHLISSIYFAKGSKPARISPLHHAGKPTTGKHWFQGVKQAPRGKAYHGTAIRGRGRDTWESVNLTG